MVEMLRALAAGFVIVFALVGGGILFLEATDADTNTTPVVAYEAEYYPANESLRLTNTGPDPITAKSVTSKQQAKVYVVIGDSGENRPRATIASDGRVSERGLWVDDNSSALKNHSDSGDSVLVVSDGTDQDGDGRAGIEPGETVTVRYFEVEHDELLNPQRITSTLYKVRACQARGTPTETPITECAPTPR